MAEQFGVQILGVLTTFVYTAAVVRIILEVLHARMGLRVDLEKEQTGLDIAAHAERGYDL